MHHHTIKTKQAIVSVFYEKGIQMDAPEITEAMQNGCVIVAQSEASAADIFARVFGIGENEFKTALAGLGSWQGAWDYFKGEQQ